MPRQDVPYGGAICRLKERIAKQERNIIKSATTMYVTDPKDLSDEVALTRRI